MLGVAALTLHAVSPREGAPLVAPLARSLTPGVAPVLAAPVVAVG